MVVTLIALTTMLFTQMERFEPDNTVLLDSATEGFDDWKRRGENFTVSEKEPGLISFANDKRDQYAHVARRFNDIGQYGFFRLSADIKTIDVKQGAKSWNCARVTLAPVDANGKKLWGLPHKLFADTGTHEWSGYSKVFATFDQVKDLILTIQLSHAPGEFQVKNIRLETVKEKLGFMIVKYLLLTLWVVTAIALFFTIAGRGDALVKPSLVIATSMVIITGALLSGGQLLAYETGIKGLFSKKEAPQKVVVSPQKETSKSTIKKPPARNGKSSVIDSLRFNELKGKGHFTMFVLVTMFAFYLWKETPVIKLFFYIALFAVSAETLQFFTYGRDVGFTDINTNLSGSAVATLVCAVANKRAWLQAKEG